MFYYIEKMSFKWNISKNKREMTEKYWYYRTVKLQVYFSENEILEKSLWP